jgi:hypothetical protein
MEYRSVGVLERSNLCPILFINPVLHYSIFLFVTRQAVIGHLLGGVAAHAPLHGHVHPWPGRRFFTLPDIPVALLTLEFPQCNMTAVREVDVVRLPVETSPGDLPSCFLKLPDFFLLWALRNRLFVTFQAGGQGRHSGKGLVFVVGMAGQAFDALFLVAFMIEGDRLVCSSANPEIEEEEKDTKPQC